MVANTGTRESLARGSVRTSRAGGSESGSVRQSKASQVGRRSAVTNRGNARHKSELGAAEVVVRDPEDGTIRTPKALVSTRTAIPKAQLAGVMSTIDDTTSVVVTSELSDAFLEHVPSMSNMSSMDGSASASEVAEEFGVERESLGQPHGARAANGLDAERSRELLAQPQPLVKQVKFLQPKDLDKVVTIQLRETATHFLLDLPAVCVNTECLEGAAVVKENEAYERLLKAKVGNDNYVSVEAQTIASLRTLMKSKEVQCQARSFATSHTQASQYDLCCTGAHVRVDSADDDSRVPLDMTSAGLVGGIIRTDAQVRSASKGSTGALRSSTMERASILSGASQVPSYSDNGAMRPNDARQGLHSDVIPALDEAQVPILHRLEGLVETLNLMESAIAHNQYQDQMLLYRDMAPLHELLGDWALRKPDAGQSQPNTLDCSASGDLEGLTTPTGLRGVSGARVAGSFEADGQPAAGHEPAGRPSVELLWEWKCDLTQGRNVSSMTWNKKQPDILAVGYGSFTFGEKQDGLVCLWSLKNPKYPLWSFKTESGVTALDFSQTAGGVLAVGMYDGNVAVYDVRSRSQEAAITSDGSTGKHSDPVWKVKCIDKESEVGSTMISISTDGRVTRWKITKGLEHTDLIKLKRTARRSTIPMNSKMASIARILKQEAFISRLTAGTAFDFSSKDDRIYLAATEDGWIHKCSTSYSEQYLESYQGHTGPVYNVQWCPYQPSLFISCSADWTVRLWKQEKSIPLLTFQSGNEAVHDVQWCPNNSTAFATATSGGRMEVWDFAVSTLRPVAADCAAGCDRTCVLFNERAPIIVTGDSNGRVSAFRLFNVGQELAEGEQRRRLSTAMEANVMTETLKSVADDV